MCISIPMHYKNTEWFAALFRIVKAVSYNKKGKKSRHV